MSHGRDPLANAHVRPTERGPLPYSDGPTRPVREPTLVPPHSVVVRGPYGSETVEATREVVDAGGWPVDLRLTRPGSRFVLDGQLVEVVRTVGGSWST